MKIGALFYICKKNKSILSRKKIIVLVLHVLHAVGTNVEEKMISQRQTKKQKKIKKSMNKKVLSRSFTIFRSLRGFKLLAFPPTVFVGLDRKGKRDEE